MVEFKHCDDWFKLTCDLVSEKFYASMSSPDDFQISFVRSDRDFYTLNMVFNTQHFVTIRQAYNLLDFLRDLGGSFGSIIALFSVIFSLISNAMLRMDFA